jgi:hypothetical protein
VLGVAAEALSLRLGYGQTYPLIVIYVVMAFLAQVAIGGALLQLGVLAAWIGWATILWNLAWLVALPIITPRDIYFPVLHHFAPLSARWRSLYTAFGCSVGPLHETSSAQLSRKSDAPPSIPGYADRNRPASRS